MSFDLVNITTEPSLLTVGSGYYQNLGSGFVPMDLWIGEVPNNVFGMDGTFDSYPVGPGAPQGWEGTSNNAFTQGATYSVVNTGYFMNGLELKVGTGTSRNSRAWYSTGVPCTPGQRMKVSWRAKTSDPARGTTRVDIFATDLFNLVVPSSPQHRLTSDFQTFEFYWTVPAGVTSWVPTVGYGGMAGGGEGEVAPGSWMVVDDFIYESVSTGVPGPMRNVTGSKINATTGRITDMLPWDDGGSPITGIRRTRNDPTGTLGGPWTTIDAPTTTFRDFLNLAPGIYEFSCAAINATGQGPTVTVTVDISAEDSGEEPATTSGRLSGIHWAEFSTDSDEAAAWRERPMDVIPLYVSKDTWANVTVNQDWILNPYFGQPNTTTTYQRPNVKQLNLFVPFVPTSESANYSQAFTNLRNGSFDTNWRNFGATLAKWYLPETIHIMPGWEFNGNWFPYNGNGLSPTDWKACFVRIVDQIRIGYANAVSPTGVPKRTLTFGTCSSSGSSPGLPGGNATIFDYFPGTAYCDSWGLNLYDIWNPVKDETTWQQKRNMANGPNDTKAFVDSVPGLKFNIPEWGVWNSYFDPAIADGAASHGNDNPFYIEKMFQWFDEVGIVDECYFEHPSTPYHWISTARTQNNPNAGARYKAILPKIV